MELGKSGSQAKTITFTVSMALAALVPAVSAAPPSIKERLAQVRAVVANEAGTAQFDRGALERPFADAPKAFDGGFANGPQPDTGFANSP